MAAGVYLHIPFCKSRCSYCDFATDVWRSGEAVERYVDALCKEVECRSPHEVRAASEAHHDTSGNPHVDTIYFGGGTPSLLNPRQVEQILRSVHDKFTVAPDAEITMEMNPATVSSETLAGYKKLGVNRASFGVQTFHDRDLKLLARGHNADDARNTFTLLRDAGFENISFDLIIGLPGQTLDDWSRNLDEARSMQPEHLSLYLLEIHQGTPLAEQIRSERRPMPDEQLAAEMYELMQERVAASAYEQYEISNFARPGFESRHNSKYWRLEPVFGFGVSAHSFDGIRRYSNERDTAAYVRSMEDTGSAEVMNEAIDRASEFAFLGLRMNEGIDLARYARQFGIDLASKYASDLGRLADADLIQIDEGRLRLTGKGMLYSNEVFQTFV